jgi:hypothetical protein
MEPTILQTVLRLVPRSRDKIKVEIIEVLAACEVI